MAAFSLEKLLGPKRYTATTPWNAWSAVAVSVAIAVAAVAIPLLGAAVTAIFFMFSLEEGVEYPPLTPEIEAEWGVGLQLGELAAMLLMQAIVVLLTFWAASRGRVQSDEVHGKSSRARHVLALQPPFTPARSGRPATSGGIGPYVIAFTGLAVCLAVYTGITWMIWPENYFKDLLQYRGVIRSDGLWLFALVIGVGAPLSEELLFRGFLLPALAQSRLGFVGAAVATSAGWTALHWGYSAISLGEIFLIGLLFSAVLWRTGSLWVTIVLHGLYNMALVVILLAIGPGS